MDKHDITINEVNNDGTLIHLYWDTYIGAWCAYGYSAYKLYLLNQSDDCKSIGRFSEDMMMPYLIVSDEMLSHVLQQSIDSAEQADSYIRIKVSGAIEKGTYNEWVRKINQ